MREKNKKMRCFVVASFPVCAFAELANSQRAREVDASGETIDASEDTPGPDSNGDRSRRNHDIGEQGEHIGEVRRHVTDKRRRKTNMVDSRFLQPHGWPLQSDHVAEVDSKGTSSWSQTYSPGRGGVDESFMHGNASIRIAGTYTNSTFVMSSDMDNSFLEKATDVKASTEGGNEGSENTSPTFSESSSELVLQKPEKMRSPDEVVPVSLGITVGGLEITIDDKIVLETMDIIEMSRPGLLLLRSRGIDLESELARAISARADSTANQDKSLRGVATEMGTGSRVLAEYRKASQEFVSAFRSSRKPEASAGRKPETAGSATGENLAQSERRKIRNAISGDVIYTISSGAVNSDKMKMGELKLEVLSRLSLIGGSGAIFISGPNARILADSEPVQTVLHNDGSIAVIQGQKDKSSLAAAAYAFVKHSQTLVEVVEKDGETEAASVQPEKMLEIFQQIFQTLFPEGWMPGLAQAGDRFWESDIYGISRDINLRISGNEAIARKTKCSPGSDSLQNRLDNCGPSCKGEEGLKKWVVLGFVDTCQLLLIVDIQERSAPTLVDWFSTEDRS
ncbi:unnamed protein product [Amoebophrya sp. A25]|nr:unnamed protein product [Amoebophrya sp. A25]|eukprot:GSA25T00025510001.1